MDTSANPIPPAPPTSAPPAPTSPSPTKKFPFMILGVGLIVVIALIIGGSLLYKSGKVSIPNITHPSSSDKSIPASGSAVPEVKISISCPSTKEFCKSATYAESSISGTLKKDDPIYAAFDGAAKHIVSSQALKSGDRENYQVVFLTNSKNTLSAVYTYKGSESLKKSYKEGELIATSNGESVSFIESHPVFIFKLSRVDNQAETPAKISREDIKN